MTEELIHANVRILTMSRVTAGERVVPTAHPVGCAMQSGGKNKHCY